ncbi:MAG: Ig-like domain-containing protein [Spirochaetaceae bacterium]|nr:Ig-like domain-containing protein [Spirochaetaceae bacterium]
MKSMLLLCGVLTMLLCGCSETGGVVAGIKLDTVSLSMAVGGSKTLVATVEPAATASQRVLWSSSDPAVATVSDTGLVTAVGNGTAIITAKSVGNPIETASCAITVGMAGIFLSAVDLNKRLLPLMIGWKETLIATVTLPPGINQAVTWSSSDPAVATVSDAGLVTAVAVGTATVTVRVTDDPVISAICKVTVTLTEPEIPAVTGVRLNKTALAFGVYSNELGHTPFEGQLNATVEPWGINQEVIWSSSNPSAATVNNKGYVTATGKGTATITAKSVDDPTKTAACVVTVANFFTGEPGMDY